MKLRNAEEKFGSADFATISEIKKAGLLNGKGLPIGYTRERNLEQLCISKEYSTFNCGTSGSGKGSTRISRELLDNSFNLVTVDAKPELRHIAGLNVGADIYSLNGYGVGCEAPWFVPQHSLDVFAFIDPLNPSFFEDVLLMAMSIAEKPKGNGGGNSEHFYQKTLSLIQAVLMDGKSVHKHFSPVDLKHVVDDIQTGSGEFFNFHIDRMKRSPYSTVSAVARELESKAQMVPAEFGSIMSTASVALRPFGSPAIQSMFASPSTITPKEFVSGDRPKQLYIMFPEYAIEQASAPIRIIATAIFVEQQRNPVRPLRFLFDEAFILGNFHLIPKICYLGRGYKATCDIFLQNYGQLLDCYGENLADTILSNCPYKLILGVASVKTAKFVSEQLGQSTYRFLPKSKRNEAAFRRSQAIQKMMGDGEFTASMLEVMKQSEALHIPDSVARPLMQPDEIIRRPNDMGLLLTQGLGLKPVQTQQRHYFLDRHLAPLYLPNPQHPPYDRIYVPNRFGRLKPVKIISEKVPSEIAHLPQYAFNEMWSYPEGFNPLKRKRFGLF
ncbi:type IV secretory system conjugative DNA transfer family protein [Paraglaciecola marina]|uniref:type IV secretory system conjugative DNA transfer family protein n=1 Tax=Paraglaciecola marina TaxID=2500157 RepID=UPI00105EEE08|nr:type IV secretory system conjugative DNA transfer family protein [Paraglaciecola marina]